VISLAGNSRQSLITLRGGLDEKLKGLSSSDCTGISTDLFSVVSALNSSIGLRRAFTDPARDAAAKAELAKDLFAKNISAKVLELVSAAAALRWSSSVDISSALEQLAIEAEATAANSDNSLDRVQEELFAFGEILADHQDLRITFGDRLGSEQGKAELVASLFGSKAAPSTVRLLTHLVNGFAGRGIDNVLEVYVEAVAARRNRLIVLVRTRSHLTPAQSEKLAAVMGKQVGQPVHLNYEIDPSVVGGISIRFGDELVDGTISTRLAEAGRALAV
jgi:F-type H+-transporting ATPase subunit delta